jgi:dihydroflavonol-4-reductase
MAFYVVTGGAGFIGSHIAAALVARGDKVRVADSFITGNRRNLEAIGGGVELVEGDLADAVVARRAVAGADYVLHQAAIPSVPRSVDDPVTSHRANVDATLQILVAAREAGVKRVVITSSTAAVAYGHPPQPQPFDETSWTNLDGADVQPYVKSKTLAERAAWDFVAREGGLELAVVNPVGIFGPVLGPDFSGSIAIMKALLDGAVPAAPKIHFALVDVRDVADLHLRAMTDPAAKGERFIAVAGETMSILDIARVLRTRLGAAGSRTPRFEAPNWLVRLAALRVPLLSAAAPQLGRIRRLSGAKARRLLGWTPRGNEEIIVATAESLLRLGLVKP